MPFLSRFLDLEKTVPELSAMQRLDAIDDDRRINE